MMMPPSCSANFGVALEVLSDLLTRVPASFWGIVAGSGLALGGIMLTNRAHDRRLQRQLAHDRELKRIERELAMRREIYLEAAQAISVGLSYIGKLADVQTPLSDLSKDYLARTPSMARVQIVALESTAEQLAKYSSAFAKATIGLITRRAPLEKQANRIKSITEEIQTISQGSSAFVVMIRDRRLAGQPLDDSVVLRNLESDRDRVTALQRELHGLVADLGPRHVAFARECQREGAALNEMLISLIGAVRRELELPYDEAVFRRIQLDAQAAIDLSFKAVLQEIELVEKSSDGA
jgi:hypothetical protein